MDMEMEKQRSEILEQLETLNVHVAKQNSLRHMFLDGVVHGLGFFLGSAILATIALGILSPWIGQIDWIREVFEKGSSLK